MYTSFISDGIKEKNKALMLLSSKTSLDPMEPYSRARRPTVFYFYFLLIIYKPIKLQFQVSK